jgi:2-iminobutanoate/2-iminopropanoate deaminase
MERRCGMKAKIVQPPDGTIPAGPWSQGVQVGNLLFVSGQVGEDASGVITDATDFRAQARRALENVEHVVRAAGGTKADIVKITAFLTDVANFPEYNDVRRAFFGARFPASTSAVVKELARPEYLLEVEAIAVLGGPPSE